MKKTTIVFLTILIFCFVLFGCSSYKAQEGYKQVLSESCSFTFDVPQDWEITYTDTMLASNNQTDKANVVAFALNTNEVLGADDYWETYKKNYENTFGQINITEFSETTLDNVIARKVVFDITINETTFTCQTIICSRYNTIYNLTFTSLSQNYLSHTQQFEQIASTFRFI